MDTSLVDDHRNTLNHDELIVAIVGSGPSGFYAAEALLKSKHNVRVNMIERLPAPFGLVRYGVAPDHPKLKQVNLIFNNIAENPKLSFFGNTELDKDITIADLRATHHVIILCYGAESDRRLTIDGANLDGSYSARDFVGWYNGHPDMRHYEFDLSKESVVIIGQGNVAADICRILTKTADELRTTDIAEHALEQIAQSKIRHLHLIGRRGPAQAKFSYKELIELDGLKNCTGFIDKKGFVIEEVDQEELTDKGHDNAAKCVEYFKKLSFYPNQEAKHTIQYHFLLSPLTIQAVQGSTHVGQMVLTRNTLKGPAFNRVAEPTNDIVTIDCGLCFSSIGYHGKATKEVSFDKERGIIPNTMGRVLAQNGSIITDLYVSGWIKRGPSGVIGTNRADSIETVNSLLDNIDALKCNRHITLDFSALLKQKNVNYVSYKQWKTIDATEIANGKMLGKSREKIVDIAQMLIAAGIE